MSPRRSGAAPGRTDIHRHPMRVVCRRTGLPAELLRVWERRYQVVQPSRTHTGRRLYSDAEVERLTLLHRATLGGRAIGGLAPLTTAALRELVRQDTEAEAAARRLDPRAAASPAAASTPAERVRLEAMQAVERFDAEGIAHVIRRAGLALPVLLFLEDVAVALQVEIGVRWRDGRLHSAQAHLAAVVLRRSIEDMIVPAPSTAPRVVVAAVRGHRQEVGVAVTAAAASASGWAVINLGADVPAEDIAEVARQARARAVGISVEQPGATLATNDELRRLRSLLPRSVPVIVSGTSAPGRATGASAGGIHTVTDLAGLATRLTRLAERKPRALRPPSSP